MFTREHQRQWRRELAEYVKQVQKPQTAYEVQRGFNRRSGWGMSYSAVYGWLAHEVKRGPHISRRRVGRSFRYEWRRLDHPLLTKPLDVAEAKLLAAELRSFAKG